MRLFLAALGISCAACGRTRRVEAGQPAPSSSVITVGIEVGTCSDIAACRRECENGSADRCRRLAASFEFGKGADQDETEATALFERACEMKDPSACVFSGQMHEFARGVSKDDAKAAQFYERACDLNWPAGCYNLAVMYERGTGVPADRGKAADLYQLTCTAGAKQACAKAAELHAPAPLPFLDGGLP